MGLTMGLLETTRRRARAGMTLAELLIGMFLLSMLTTAAYATYALSLRYQLITQSALDLQSSAIRATQHIVDDLQDSNANSVRDYPIAPYYGIVFISPRDAQNRFVAGPTWEAWVGYYIDTNHNLIRKRVPITPTTVLPANLWNFGGNDANDFLLAAGTIVHVAENDTYLDLAVPNPLNSGAIGLSATFTISVWKTGDCQINIQDAAWPRN